MIKIPFRQAIILFAAATLAAGCMLAPGQPAAAPSGNVLGNSRQAGPFTVLLLGTPNPPVRGGNTLEAVITDAKGEAVDGARVSFDLDMTTMSHGKNVVVATARGAGHYVGAVSYAMGGPWRVIVTVEKAGQPPQSVRFELSVSTR